MSTSRNLVSVPGPGSCYSAWTVEWLLVKTNKPIRSARLLWGVFPPSRSCGSGMLCNIPERKKEHNTEHQTNKTDKRIVGSDSWSHSGGQGRASCFLFTSSFVLLCRGPDWNNEEIKTPGFFSNSDSKKRSFVQPTGPVWNASWNVDVAPIVIGRPPNLPGLSCLSGL